MLERHVVWRALSRAWANTGKRIAAKMAMIAITTRSSISVNPRPVFTRLGGHDVCMRGAPFVREMTPPAARAAVQAFGVSGRHMKIRTRTLTPPYEYLIAALTRA